MSYASTLSSYIIISTNLNAVVISSLVLPSYGLLLLVSLILMSVACGVLRLVYFRTFSLGAKLEPDLTARFDCARILS